MDALVDVILNAPPYSYPRFRVEIDEDGDIRFGDDLRGRLEPDGHDTDENLDGYHCSLLRAESAARNLVGLASVVYWGYARSGYAPARVHRLLHGYGRQLATTPQAAATCLRNAFCDLEQHQYGRALSRFAGVSQLGRTPFASKVIAFLCPDWTGVYDNKIASGLVNHEFLRQYTTPGRVFYGCTDGIGQVQSPRIQAAYLAWCEALISIANYIRSNRHGINFRALDIERRIFAIVQ